MTATNARIYLAGPILGWNHGEANLWRQDVAAKLAKFGMVGVNPLRGEEYAKDFVHDCGHVSESKYRSALGIAIKNRLDVKACDGTIAVLPDVRNSPNPSYGTWLEIGWAIDQEKPLVIVTDDPIVKSHPLVRAMVPWVVEDVDTAVSIMHDLFKVYANDA